MSELIPDPEVRFTCKGCGVCCTSGDDVLISEAERRELEARLEAGGRRLFLRRGGAWALARDRDTGRCALLTEGDRCEPHERFGEAAKPAACRRFPFVSAPAAGALHVSASFGCSAVQEGRGAPLKNQTAALRRAFAQEVAELDPDARPPEGAGPLKAMAGKLGKRLFPAMRRLAAFAESAPVIPGGAYDGARPTEPLGLSGPARYAFALTVQSDALDTSRLMGRIQGVFTLPRLMGFVHVYRSLQLDEILAMGQIWRHPGVLPPESESLLLRFLRSRLRSRLALRRAPSLAAGVTRLLLEVDLALYFARGLAGEGPVTHAGVRRGLTLAERMNHPLWGGPDLSRHDPRLPELWSDPGVARAAAILFEPNSPR